MEIRRWVLFGILLNIYVCEGYKILAVFPFPSKSHGILGHNLVKHLADAGHEVTYITPFIENKINPNIHQIDASGNKDLFNENTLNIKQIMDKQLNMQDASFMAEIMYQISTQTLEYPNIQKLMRDPNQKFDVVIVEWLFSDILSAFAPVFECPFILFSTLEPHWIVTNLIDGPLNPAYNADYLNERIHPFSFMGRVAELWTQVRDAAWRNYYLFYKEEETYLRLVAPVLKEKDIPVPPFEKIKYNASLLLGNTQVVIGDAMSLPQNYKHIGGFHIEDEVEPLPGDLKKMLDNAIQGVIYFSLGSNVKSKDLPLELKRGLLKVFGDLNQTVIWKFEKSLNDIPKNVHIMEWAPQQSILAHPNTVLFVTHGGLLSITETIYFGKPIISIPIYGDQFPNSLRAEKKGFGKKVDLSYTMYNDLKIALDEVLGDSKYSEKVKELSLAYHDRYMKPKEELVHWVNHVVRTRGSPHLQSPALQIPLYQRLYLDLVVVISVLILVLRYLLKQLLYLLTKVIRSRKQKQL